VIEKERVVILLEVLRLGVAFEEKEEIQQKIGNPKEDGDSKVLQILDAAALSASLSEVIQSDRCENKDDRHREPDGYCPQKYPSEFGPN